MTTGRCLQKLIGTVILVAAALHADVSKAASVTDFVEMGARGMLLTSDEDNHLIRSPDGLPQLAKWALLGDCGQESNRRIDVAPINGPNWKGLLTREQSYPEIRCSAR